MTTVALMALLGCSPSENSIDSGTTVGDVAMTVIAEQSTSVPVTVSTVSPTTQPAPGTAISETSRTTMSTAPTPSPTTFAAPRPESSLPRVTAAPTGPRTVTFVIPPGTADRIAAGEDVGEVLPASLTLTVGDTLVLDNRDTVYHLYGPISARSGEVVRWVVPSPGTFIGTCTANTDRQIVLTVVEAA